MVDLDWTQCPAVESDPEKRSGAYVFRNTRMPVSAVFDNLDAGASIEEIMDWFDVTRQEISDVLRFVAATLEAPAVRVVAEREAHHAHTV